MEEMLSQLISSQDATAKSIVENTRSQEVSARALEAKVSALAQSHISTDDKLSHIAYTQIEQIAEMSDLVDRISTVERLLKSPVEEEEEEEEVGFRPLRVKGRPIDKGSVDATQGQRLRVVYIGENLGQERIIKSHAVGPEVQGSRR